MRAFALALALLGCGPPPSSVGPGETFGAEVALVADTTSAAEAERDPATATASEREGEVATESETENVVASPGPLAALRAALAPREQVTAPVALVQAADRCPRPGDECELLATAGYDASTRSWIVLDVDASEGGPESAAIGAASVDRDETIASFDLESGSIAPLRRALRAYRSLAAPVDLVRDEATTTFSLDEVAVLVTLGPPLEGWMLHLETTSDLDHPEHVLALVRDGARVELGRRAADRGPCDGDGWVCAATQWNDLCTPEQLRAEDRLCVEPAGIEHVAVAADRSSMIVIGHHHPAGHGGYPPFHWVVALDPSMLD